MGHNHGYVIPYSGDVKAFFNQNCTSSNSITNQPNNENFKATLFNPFAKRTNDQVCPSRDMDKLIN